MANSYLSNTISSGSTGKIFTLSAWVKFTSLSTNSELWSVSNDGTVHNYIDICFKSGVLDMQFKLANGQTFMRRKTTKLFRDPNAFYHIVLRFDSTNSTAADRFRLYVNGVQETSFDNDGTASTFPSDFVTALSTNGANQYIGRTVGYTSYWNGYMSHVALVDGQSLAPTSFGETDSTSGIWKFKSPSGITWGTNGFHLKFENSGAMGTDSSGNSNTFTVNGNLKQALDTPSNVYATMNPLDNYYPNSTFSNGNNTIVTNNYNPTFATLAVSSGKWYWEVKVDSTSTEDMIGIRGEQTRGDYDYNGTYDFFYNSKARFYDGSSGSQFGSYGATFTTGDIIGVALDCTSAQNTIQFYKNGSAQGSKNITNVSSTTLGVYNIALGDYTSGASATFSVNFGNGFFGTTAITSAGSNGNGSLFEYDVPSGYYALNTKNINTYG